MRSMAFRPLGVAVQNALLAAWTHVALVMDRQLHDVPRRSAPTPEAATSRPPSRGQYQRRGVCWAERATPIRAWAAREASKALSSAPASGAGA